VFVSWRDGNGEVYAMDADGSEPRNLTQHPAKDVRPAWSPDGRRIAFVSQRDGNGEIYVINADGSGKRNLTRDRANDDYPTWSPDGRRIAFLRSRLQSRTVDVSTWHPRPANCSGSPRRCVFRFFSPSQLYVMDADGSGLRRLTLTGTYRYRSQSRSALHQLIWSPDGRTIYFGRYLVRTDGSGARRLPYIPLTAVWSPDGRRIAFSLGLPVGSAPVGRNHEIYVMNADGSGSHRLTHNRAYDGQPAWSPDGRKIAFLSTRTIGGNSEIYVMNADGSGKRNLTRHPAKDGRPSWSPDGRRIAFVSDRDGRLEAHVMNADGSGQRNLTLQDS
jgi:Tol biopolymer transport system component